MIRDLRYEELERAAQRKRLVRLALTLVLVSTAVTFVVSRERAIHSEWTGLPVANSGDLASLQLRRDSIEEMLEQRSFWTGVFRATKERDALVVAIHNEERLLTRAEEQADQQKRRQLEEAEASRVRALQHVERGDYDRAIEQFERALAVAEPSWEHVAQIRVDLAALQKWKADHAPTGATENGVPR
jgi:tetratricopeptide (TPR) repeat protein